MRRMIEAIVFDEDLVKLWLLYIAIFSVAFVFETLAYSWTSHTFLNEILEKLRSSLPSTRNPLVLFTIIFFHNILIAFILMLLSPTFIVPAVVMFFNGLVTGYVISYAFGRLSITGSIAGLIPHGGLEIPAVALAAATGITIKRGLREYLNTLKSLASVALLMLLIAAITESIITPILVTISLYLRPVP